jgi:hypothetical protein
VRRPMIEKVGRSKLSGRRQCRLISSAALSTMSEPGDTAMDRVD